MCGAAGWHGRTVGWDVSLLRQFGVRSSLGPLSPIVPELPAPDLIRYDASARSIKTGLPGPGTAGPGPGGGPGHPGSAAGPGRPAASAGSSDHQWPPVRPRGPLPSSRQADSESGPGESTECDRRTVIPNPAALSAPLGGAGLGTLGPGRNRTLRLSSPKHTGPRPGGVRYGTLPGAGGRPGGLFPEGFGTSEFGAGRASVKPGPVGRAAGHPRAAGRGRGSARRTYRTVVPGALRLSGLSDLHSVGSGSAAGPAFGNQQNKELEFCVRRRSRVPYRLWTAGLGASESGRALN
eukprot:605681-Hanusia_phi.AAC.3